MRRKTTILLLSATIYVSAWFLPVINGGTTLAKGGLPGWEALRVALSPEDSNALTRVLRVGSGLSNFVFVAAVTLLWRWPRQFAPAALWSLIVAVLLNAHWFVLLGADRWNLRVGYYLWVSSFLLLAFAAHTAKSDAPPT